MDLAPYLKLMVEKRADFLILQTDKVPSLRLLNQEKTVGNTVFSAEFIIEFIDGLLNETQIKDLSNLKTIRLSYTHATKLFIVQIEKNLDDYIIQISVDKRSLSKMKLLLILKF